MKTERRFAKEAWQETKQEIDENWESYPLHQGTCDMTEVIDFPLRADWYMLTNRQYNNLIDKAQAYFDNLNAVRFKILSPC